MTRVRSGRMKMWSEMRKTAEYGKQGDVDDENLFSDREYEYGKSRHMCKVDMFRLWVPNVFESFIQKNEN